MDAAKSGSGLDPKISGLLSWIFAPVTSLIFIIIEKDEFAKFHAWQSLIWSLVGYVGAFVIYSIASIITFGIGAVCCGFIPFLPFIVNIIGAIKAYNGEMWKLPVIGDFSEQQAKK